MEPKATVSLDMFESAYIEMFRFALSETTHEARMGAIRMVRHDVTANRLNELLQSAEYRRRASPEDYSFLRWAAETASLRHEAAIGLMDLETRFQAGQQRKLNVAEEIGIRVFHSVREGEFKGIQVYGGILERVRDDAKQEGVHGARDFDTLRGIWKTYRGVVHFGMAITYLEDNPDQPWDVLELAEKFRSVLSSNCPKGTRQPYVRASEQIKFHYLSRVWGPRYRDRGLPFFTE